MITAVCVRQQRDLEELERRSFDNQLLNTRGRRVAIGFAKPNDTFAPFEASQVRRVLDVVPEAEKEKPMPMSHFIKSNLSAVPSWDFHPLAWTTESGALNCVSRNLGTGPWNLRKPKEHQFILHFLVPAIVMANT